MRKLDFSRYILYTGLTKEEYQAVSDNILEENDKLLTIYAMITMMMLTVLTLLTRDTESFGGRNRTIYIVAAVACILIAWASIRLTGKFPKTVPFVVLCFECVLYALGIAVSVAHADLPGVTEIAFLLIVPLLFIDRPIYIALKTVAAALAFCLVTRTVKEPEVAVADVYNTMVFSIAAIAIGIFITKMKLQNLIQAERITYLSETDVLTGIKNRNSYEDLIQRLPELTRKHVTCIYADVNGLHALNDSQGHAAGDRMLQAVADSMKKHFGEEHLYRVGGDEFVVIRIDREELTDEIARVVSDIEAQDYHMSFGISSSDRDKLDTQKLIREAEEMMYQEKTEYYIKSGKPVR
ncbi:MAG: GGDEF domain-containing protein [Oscillospiraceae bacterium]|nr:GGDEF domain-containing protein [Oscillospiraceae bacterium]